MGVAECKTGQLRKEANSKQNSYMTLIGVHSTVHLMHHYVTISYIPWMPKV